MQNQITFKQKTLVQLKIAAKEYSFFLNKKIVLSSTLFKYRKKYTLRFYETNFLHLTGVITKLSAYEFYEKCLNGSIKEKDFETAVEGCPQVKGYIRLKMRNLIHISSFFNAKFLFKNDSKGTLFLV